MLSVDFYYLYHWGQQRGSADFQYNHCYIFLEQAFLWNSRALSEAKRSQNSIQRTWVLIMRNRILFISLRCYLDLHSGCRWKSSLYWSVVHSTYNNMEETSALSPGWPSYCIFNRSFHCSIRPAALHDVNTINAMSESFVVLIWRKTSFSSVQSLSCVRHFVTPWTTEHQASLSFTS